MLALTDSITKLGMKGGHRHNHTRNVIHRVVDHYGNLTARVTWLATRGLVKCDHTEPED